MNDVSKQAATLSDAQKLEWLWAHSQIEGVMLRFGRALDLGDWPAYRSCFADRFRVDFTRLTGQPEVWVDADLWTRFADVILSPVRRHHQYSNVTIKLDGDRAEGLIYMVSRHWKPVDTGDPGYTQIGWYENTFERIRGEWKIVRLMHTYSWIEGNGALFDFSDPELIRVMGQVFDPRNKV